MAQKSILDIQERTEKLKDKKHFLTCLLESIPWKAFRPLLDKRYNQEYMSNAGRLKIDPLILFRILVLKQPFNLSDDEVKFQANDRSTFEEFFG